MNKHVKDTLKHSSIALIISIVLALLITWARTNPANSFQMAWTGVVVCLMLTLNYARNWKIEYLDNPRPSSWWIYIKNNWKWELLHFVSVNVVFVIPLILFKSF